MRYAKLVNCFLIFGTLELGAGGCSVHIDSSTVSASSRHQNSYLNPNRTIAENFGSQVSETYKIEQNEQPKPAYSVNGLPTQPGETSVVNNSFSNGGTRYEVDGVCKFGEDDIVCWKPDGSPNQTLSQALKDARDHPYNSNSSSSYAVSLDKMNRTLYLKQIQEKYGMSNGDYGRVYGTRSESIEARTGWTEYPTMTARTTGFNGAETIWSGIPGVFDLNTKEFPFRYEFTNSMLKTSVQQLKLGRFEVDGNTFDITNIGKFDDLPDDKKRIPVTDNSMRPHPLPKTFIEFKVISVANPHSSFSARLADEAGKPIENADESGNIASGKVAPRTYSAARSSTFVNRPTGPETMVAGGFGFDPKFSSKTQLVYFWLTPERCKNLSISVSSRKVFVFDNIQLNPK